MTARRSWLLVLALAGPTLLVGAVDKIEVADRSVVLDGRSFGTAGPYERVIGKVHFLVDPDNEANQTISDIGLAPVNEDGLVEFSADLYVLKPRDPAKGNGTILFDVVNRGNKVMLEHFNFSERAADPRTEAHLGDGFLLEEGFTLVWLGWQFDVPREAERMRINVPVARNPDGTPITGLVRADFVPNERITSQSLADRGHIAYPVINPDDPSVRLTVRDRVDASRAVIPREKWQFSSDRTAIEMKTGFEPGKVYEVVYKAKDPALVGLGPAAVRDLISFLKYNKPRKETALGSDSAHLQRAIGYGVSQSGRFLRTLLYYGLNRDEQGRQVFDAVWAHVAGGGRGSFNHRFAQPSRDAHPHMNFFYPTDIYPFADLPERDPETGLEEGILSRAIEQDVAPKIFYTNTSYEYWGRAASLTHTSLDGKRDEGPAKDTRIYLLTGTQHGAGRFPPTKTGTQHLSNPNDYRWALRGLLVALNRWVTDGREPPASRYPTIAGRQLVPLEEVRFPSVPGVEFPTRMHRAYRVDYGPEFYSKGIVTKEPPAVSSAFPMLVPQVDSDGNEVAGIRLPIVQASLGSYTGWNLRAPEIGAPLELADMIGSFLPYATTKAERERRRDARPSLEERFENRESYRSRLRAAAETLAKDGYLREADIEGVVEAGLAQWSFVVDGQ